MWIRKGQSLLVLLLSTFLLLSSGLVWAQQVHPPVQAEKKEEEPEVRDQNLLVPTKNGVQKATKKEFDMVQELEKKTTDELVGNYLVGDYKSGQILMAKGAEEVLGLASTTKLMTVYVVLDAVASGEISMEDKVVIDKEAATMIGSTYKTKENEVYTVKDLIEAGLVVSGNDAMVALAKHIAGSQENFIKRMDQKAQDLGLTHAHFINVHGLTDYEKNDYNKMTAKELFIMTRQLLKDHPQIIQMTKLPYIRQEGRGFLGYNTNPILGVLPQVDGLKTGYTNAAGRCLVATALSPASQDKEDTRLIGVFMNCSDNWTRYVGTKRLMEDSIRRFTYKEIANPQNSVDKLSIREASPRETPVYPRKARSVLVDQDKYLQNKISYKQMDLPIKKGERVGKIQYYLGDRLIYETDLVTHEEIRSPNPIFRLKDKISQAFTELDELVAKAS